MVTIEEETEETDQTEEEMITELTNHEKLKHDMRFFLELYTTEENEIILGALVSFLYRPNSLLNFS